MGYQLREVRPNTKSGLPVSGNAFQHSTVYSGAPAENASQGPVSSSSLDEQPHHHSKRSTQVVGHGGVHGNAGVSWQVKTPTNPVVGRHGMVPEDWELDRQDHSSSVGSARSGLVGITCSPARYSSRHSGNGSHAVHRCVQLGLGSPTRLTLDSGTVVSVSKIIAYKRSGDACRHQSSEGLPASSEVQSGSLDVRQRSHGCLHQERGGHSILHSHAADDTPAEVVRSQGHQAWCHSIYQECATSRRMHCPGSAKLSTPSRRWPWNVYDQCFTSGVIDRHVCYVRQQTTDQVCLTISGPQGRVEGCDVHYWGQWEGFLYSFLPFKLVPQVLQKIYHSHGVQMILVAPKQETASWFPELQEQSHEDPIPLYAQGQPLLTQDVTLPDRETETCHYWPSNLHAWRLCSPS